MVDIKTELNNHSDFCCLSRTWFVASEHVAAPHSHTHNFNVYEFNKKKTIKTQMMVNYDVWKRVENYGKHVIRSHVRISTFPVKSPVYSIWNSHIHIFFTVIVYLSDPSQENVPTV